MQSRSPITEQSDWFNKQYGVTAANSTAVLRHAKHEFTNGAIDRAIRCLDLYVTMPMSGDDHIVTGWHLLAHCFLRLGGDRTPDAVKCFAHSATAGLDEDWQMVVETLCDIDSEVSAIIASQRSIGASGLTIETMPTAAKVSSSPKVSPRNLFPDKHSPR